MSGVPETTDIPIRPKVADEEPVEEKPIKIYSFSIDKLCEDNARYWFSMIKDQLNAQACWDVVEFYQAVGEDTFNSIIQMDKDWNRINLKAMMVMNVGLNKSTKMEVSKYHHARRRWSHLKEKFLKSSNSKKANKLMRMSNWTWN